jgi:hypothetical protein
MHTLFTRQGKLSKLGADCVAGQGISCGQLVLVEGGGWWRIGSAGAPDWDKGQEKREPLPASAEAEFAQDEKGMVWMRLGCRGDAGECGFPDASADEWAFAVRVILAYVKPDPIDTIGSERAFFHPR